MGQIGEDLDRLCRSWQAQSFSAEDTAGERAGEVRRQRVVRFRTCRPDAVTSGRNVLTPVRRLPTSVEKLRDLAASPHTRDPAVANALRGIVPENVEALDEEAAAEILNRAIRALLDDGQEQLLGRLEIPYPRYPAGSRVSGRPASPPRWDRASVNSSDPDWHLLGFQVGFPIGVPSSELTATPDWIEFYARRGFHVLTFRTVRSKMRRGAPQWPFVDGVDHPWQPDELPQSVRTSPGPSPSDWRGVSTATPFDAPSSSSDVWQRQVRDALRAHAEIG